MYAAIGRISYSMLLPVMRPVLRRTHRAYVIIYANGSVLVVKNWLSRQDWRLPGGGVRGGESPELALVRELEEEIGLAVVPEALELVSNGFWPHDKLRFSYLIYIINLPEMPHLQLKKREIVGYKWLSPRQLQAGSHSEISAALQAAGLLAKG